MVAAGGDAVLKKKVKKIKTAPATADVEAVPSDKKIKKQKSTDAGQEKEVKKKKRKAESEAPSAVSEEPVKKKKAKKAEPEAKGPSPAGSDSAESEQCALDISDSKPADPLAIDNFRLSPAVKALLRQKGIEALFHIQAQTLTSVLDGFDLVGRARYHTRLLSSCISIHLSLSPWLLSSMGPSPVVTSWLALASCLNTSACSSLMAPFTSSCAAPSVQQNWTEQGTGVCAACCEAGCWPAYFAVQCVDFGEASNILRPLGVAGLDRARRWRLCCPLWSGCWRTTQWTATSEAACPESLCLHPPASLQSRCAAPVHTEHYTWHQKQ